MDYKRQSYNNREVNIQAQLYEEVHMNQSGFIEGRSYKRSKYTTAYYDFVNIWSKSTQYQNEISFFLQQIPTIPNHSLIIDVGCGSGNALAMICQRFPQACTKGVDIQESRCCHEGMKKMITYADAESLPFPDESVDLVLFIHSLGHIEDPFKAMVEAARVLKKTGFVGILTPNLKQQKMWLDLSAAPFLVEQTVLRYMNEEIIADLCGEMFDVIKTYTFGHKPFGEGSEELLAMYMGRRISE